jgi:chromosome segregation ATPase
MEDIKNIYRKAQEEGNQGQAREASQHLEKLTAELQEIRQHFSRGPEGNDDRQREIRHDRDQGEQHGERMEHLHAAMEHLHAGGFGDLAQMIERKVDEMRRQDDRSRYDQDDRQTPSRVELEHVVRELGQQLERLGRELQHVRRTLEESNR